MLMIVILVASWVDDHREHECEYGRRFGLHVRHCWLQLGSLKENFYGTTLFIFSKLPFSSFSWSATFRATVKRCPKSCESSSVAFSNIGILAFGITRKWVGAWALISRKANEASSSYKIEAGISFLIILSKRVSSWPSRLWNQSLFRNIFLNKITFWASAANFANSTSFDILIRSRERNL